MTKSLVALFSKGLVPLAFLLTLMGPASLAATDESCLATYSLELDAIYPDNVGVTCSIDEWNKISLIINTALQAGGIDEQPQLFVQEEVFSPEVVVSDEDSTIFDEADLMDDEEGDVDGDDFFDDDDEYTSEGPDGLFHDDEVDDLLEHGDDDDDFWAGEGFGRRGLQQSGPTSVIELLPKYHSRRLKLSCPLFEKCTASWCCMICARCGGGSRRSLRSLQRSPNRWDDRRRPVRKRPSKKYYKDPRWKKNKSVGDFGQAAAPTQEMMSSILTVNLSKWAMKSGSKCLGDALAFKAIFKYLD